MKSGHTQKDLNEQPSWRNGTPIYLISIADRFALDKIRENGIVLNEKLSEMYENAAEESMMGGHVPMDFDPKQ
jgi:hypothetical protein